MFLEEQQVRSTAEPSLQLPPYFLRQSLSLNLEVINGLGWLANKPTNPPVSGLCPTRTMRLQGCVVALVFTRMLEIQIQVLGLAGQTGVCMYQSMCVCHSTRVSQHVCVRARACHNMCVSEHVCISQHVCMSQHVCVS